MSIPRFEAGPTRQLSALARLCRRAAARALGRSLLGLATLAMMWGMVHCMSGNALAAQQIPAPAPRKRRPTKPHAGKKAASTPQPIVVAVPFHPGEVLEYAAQWNKFVTAASINLKVVARSGFYGRDAWHFQAIARTLDPVRLFYPLDDQFDSYTDAGSLASLQYEAYIREQKKESNLVVPMASAPPAAKETAKGRAKAGTTTPKAPAPPLMRGDTHLYMVLPGTRDPLGLLYTLRAHDWQAEPSPHFPVFDGRRFYDVAAQKESGGVDVVVAAGSYRATRVALRVFESGKEMKNVKFWVSLTQDAAHTPVLIEAEVPFGTVRVELTSIR